MKTAKLGIFVSTLFFLTLVLTCFLPFSAWAATFLVNSTTDAVDANPGNGVCATAAAQCTLRAAIQEANVLGGGPHFITVPAGTYTLTIAGLHEEACATGDLDINANITISGAGADVTIVDGGGLDRIFHVQKNYVSTITGMTIRNGHASPGPTEPGGGVLVEGTLTLTDVDVNGNLCDDRGGGIYVMKGSLTLTRVTVSGNTAGGNGGGIGGESATTVTAMTNVTVSNNTAANGGGVYDKKVTDFTMINVTITGNAASGSGGGVYQTSGAFTLKNTIVANSTSGGNCFGTITSSGYNLDSANTCGLSGTGDLINTDPQLGPLQNNGGTMSTHALLSGSPAIDAGTNTGCPAVDQRGISRPRDGNGDTIATCDMGAFEAFTPSLAIFKSLWEVNGAAPISSPASAAVGSTIVFLIYVRNTTAGAISDVRINDNLDETGFQYVSGSLVRASAASPPTDTASEKQIFDAAAPGTGTALSDAVDGDVASAVDTGGLAGADRITIGAVSGQANGSLTINAHTTYALRFQVKVK